MRKRRKQVYIDEHQETALKRLSVKHHQSEAMLIREALDNFLGGATPANAQDPSAWLEERLLILERMSGKRVRGRRMWTRNSIHDRR